MSQIDSVREHFPVTETWVYMNHATMGPLSTDMFYGIDMRADEIMRHGSVNHMDWEDDIIQTRMMYAQLLECRPEEVSFIRDTCDGVNLVANGIDWRRDDNVVLVRGEYPANVYPWMNQKHRGVEIKWVRKRDDGRVPVEDITAAVDGNTRVVALSFVDWIDGYRYDLEAIGDFCNRRNIFFFVDAIQGLGAIRIDVQKMKISALASASRKWLLCPGGVGVLYLRNDVLDRVRVTSPGPGSVINAMDVLDYDLTFRDSARRFEGSLHHDPIAFSATRAMLAMFVGLDMSFVEERVLRLTDLLCEGLKRKGYTLHSPRGEGEKSGIVTFSSKKEDAETISKRLTRGHVIQITRFDKVRLSPHFYNTETEVQKVLSLL